MIKYILGIILALCTIKVFATDVYVCDCQAGHDTGCVAGNDSTGNGSSATPYQTLAKPSYNTLAAGSNVYYCSGGSWTLGTAIQIANFNVTATSPLTLTSYQAGWGGLSKPLITTTTNSNNVFTFSDGGTDTQDGGYVVKGLKLAGATTVSAGTQYGIQTYYWVRNLTVDSVDMDHFQAMIVTGTTAGQPTHYPTFTTVKNSTFTFCGQNGVISEGTDVLIENNVFNSCAWSSQSSGFDKHAVYLSGVGNREIIRGNTFIDNCTTAHINGSNPIVVHGTRDQIVIENNTITESGTPFDTAGCYGISVKPGYDITYTEVGKHVTIRGNTIQGVSGIGIAMESTPHSVVENNVIVDTNGLINNGIYMACNGACGNAKTATSYDISASYVRNNTVYFASTNTATSVGYTWRNDSSSGHVFTNNLVYYGSSAISTRYCYSPGFSSGSFTNWSNNLCYFASGTGTHQWSSGNATAPAGFTTGDILGSDPLLVTPTSGNNWAPTINSAGSPANGAGNHTYASTKDRKYYTRLNPPSIGAYEYGASSSTVAPESPTGTR